MDDREITERYRLSFFNRIDCDGCVVKCCTSVSQLLDSLLFDHVNLGARLIIDEILPTIQHAIDGIAEQENESLAVSSESVDCYFRDGLYCFYNGFRESGAEYVPPDYVMPPEDLFMVFRLWAKFIVSNPAYGSVPRMLRPARPPFIPEAPSVGWLKALLTKIWRL